MIDPEIDKRFLREGARAHLNTATALIDSAISKLITAGDEHLAATLAARTKGLRACAGPRSDIDWDGDGGGL